MMPGKKDMAGEPNRKARRPPWSSMDNWVPERHVNLSLERKKAMVHEKNQHQTSLRDTKGALTTSRKNTSSQQEKRRTWVESSVSGKKLNIYLDVNRVVLLGILAFIFTFIYY
jgi:hypothetical protein